MDFVVEREDDVQHIRQSDHQNKNGANNSQLVSVGDPFQET
jgi:hypothetical protein